MGRRVTADASKSVTQLMELAKVEFDAGRAAKGTRLLVQATERAIALEDAVIILKVQSAIEHSTLVSDLRAVYGLGGIPTRRSS